MFLLIFIYNIYDVMDLKLIKTVKVRWKSLDMFEPEADGYV